MTFEDGFLYIMSAVLSPEKEDPDLQLSLFSDKSDDKPQIHHMFMPEGPVPKDSTEYCPSETLFMIRIKLKHVPPNILTNGTLKHLYLEGNQISSLPESLFTSLPRLLWLDLRNNQITSLPVEIGLHRCLRALLLEGNLISALPPELGNVMSLKALNLRYCPIVFPPRDVVQQGLQTILRYLRAAIAQRPVGVRASLPELPEVEKLQLSELVGSSTEELADEDELQRFRELKHKIILLDRTELGPLPAKEYTNPKSHFLPVIKRKTETAKASIMPPLPLSDTQHQKKPDEWRRSTMKAIEKFKAKEALQQWRRNTKNTEELKMQAWRQKQHEKQRSQKEAELKAHTADSKFGPALMQICITCESKCHGFRTPHGLEQHIHAHVERMQDQRRNPSNIIAEQISAAERDIREVKKLQAWLEEMKKC